MPKEVKGIIDLDSKIPKIVKITIIKMKISYVYSSIRCSAICILFKAAPFLTLSATTHKFKEFFYQVHFSIYQHTHHQYHDHVQMKLENQ